MAEGFLTVIIIRWQSTGESLEYTLTIVAIKPDVNQIFSIHYPTGWRRSLTRHICYAQSCRKAVTLKTLSPLCRPMLQSSAILSIICSYSPLMFGTHAQKTNTENRNTTTTLGSVKEPYLTDLLGYVGILTGHPCDGVPGLWPYWQFYKVNIKQWFPCPEWSNRH